MSVHERERERDMHAERERHACMYLPVERPLLLSSSEAGLTTGAGSSLLIVMIGSYVAEVVNFGKRKVMVVLSPFTLQAVLSS